MPAVKICGLTRPEDGQVAAAAGAVMVGLIFAEASKRRVTIAQARRIAAVLPVQVLRVGVFRDQDAGWVEKVAREVGLDRLQFHGHETAAYLRRFQKFRVIRALWPESRAKAPVRDPAPDAAALLVDACVPGQAGGTGVVSNWKYARGLRRFDKTVILSGGLTPANVQAAIRQARPDVVDVCSGVEIRPGIKSAAKIRAFLKAVEVQVV